MDRQRPYFDSRGPSDLEDLLQHHDFDDDAILLDRARRGMRLLVEGGISKYNNSCKLTLSELLGRKKRHRVLVLGQVEDDASIRFGCDRDITNNDLVRLAAEENPGSEIVYKPHPDVLNGLRKSQSNPEDVADVCTILRANIPLAQTFATIDRAYTITSLSGFEALMHKIPLTVIGCPFYAGWGLTDDRQPTARRNRARTLEEVFAIAYLQYPRYYDPCTGESISFEDAVDWLKVRLASPEKYISEFDDPSPEWRAWGPYGVLGWRHLLTAVVAPIIAFAGSKKDARNYRVNPIRFFRELSNRHLRLLGRILYPFG